MNKPVFKKRYASTQRKDSESSNSSEIQSYLPKAAIYAILSTVMSKQQAKNLSGYVHVDKISPDVTPYQMEVNEIRQRLSDMPGFVSYLDQITELHNIRTEAKDDGNPEIRLAANKEINKLQGYMAPDKVEIENKIKISGAIMEFKAIVGKTGLNIAQIKEERQRRETSYQEIKPAQITSEIGVMDEQNRKT